MITPAFLQKGDKIGLVAPARKIVASEISRAITFIEKQGFSVECAPKLYASENQFAGNDIERVEDFQYMLDNPEIKAILAVRGGYGSVRIIDKIDFSSFVKQPKWICGYSDITVFHSHIHSNFQIETLHCAMPLNLNIEDENSLNLLSLLDALSGKTQNYLAEPHTLNRFGKTSGILIGGNLSILYSLTGSISDINTDNKILLIEDLDEYLYHIDRMMLNLKRNGKLDHLAGLIVGGMSEMKDNSIPFGKKAEEIIAEHCAEYDFPVCFNFPVGHEAKNYAVRLGKEITLAVDEQGGHFY